MEDVPAAIAAIPELAPGIILGALGGIGYGFWKDHTEGSDDLIPLSWWQAGGLGAVLGALAWMAVLTLS